MTRRARIARIATIPDKLRLERCLRLPELGPRILFFSGGSALRSVSRTLKKYTHNSIHIITPFDSGGSSAKLRDTFGMLAIGDLRNRLMALADESVKGNPEIYRLFSHRLDATGSPEQLRAELHDMVRGEHALVAEVDEPMRRLIRTHLRTFAEQMPPDFDLQLANVGNLILAGGYLANEGDIQSVIFLFSRLVEVRGAVRPVVEANYHLAAELATGRSIVGQHKISEQRSDGERIAEIRLVNSLDEPVSVQTTTTEDVRRLIRSADLICFPIGSFYTSVIANLLPRGVGSAICESPCPKVYIPNLGSDVEQVGMTLSDSVRAIIDQVRRDLSEEVAVDKIINLVFVDSCSPSLSDQEDCALVRRMGIEIVELPLTRDADPSRHDPERVTEALLSLV